MANQRRKSSNVGFGVVLAGMVIAAAAIVWQRGAIRARWWAGRLAAATTAEAQAYYVACLSAEGEDALPAAARLVKDPRAEVRSLGLAILGHLRGDGMVGLVAGLVNDSDVDIRETAALTLAFGGTVRAAEALRDAATSAQPEPACAALAALGRVADPWARAVLCDALRTRSEAIVRAQAAEALAEALAPAGPMGDAAAAGTGAGTENSTGAAGRVGGGTTQPAGACDPVLALVLALADRGEFEGALATERQVAAVAGFARGRTTMPVETTTRAAGGKRTVAAVAAAGLSKLTGREVVPVERMDAETALRRVEEVRGVMAGRGGGLKDER